MRRVYRTVVALRAALEHFADSLYGCAHRKTGFPITVGVDAGMVGQQAGQAETYVVCLDCGRRLPYDWVTMRITRRRTTSKTATPGSQ